jgi:GrpB-like predicted nucleotidyltransferase (UPF0157 family)
VKGEKKMRKVQVVPYDAEWVRLFEKERGLLERVIGAIVVDVHHIGSTSIPHMAAKPIIDLLIEVTDIEAVDLYNDALAQLGYEARGENGLSGRRFFTKGGDQRTHHVHIFNENDPEVKRHLLFRDYLIAHPAEAQQYRTLKETLAQTYVNDIDSYVAGKHAFIQRIDRLAMQWRE